MEGADFWNDNQKAQKVISELKQIKTLIGPLPGLEQQSRDLVELLELSAGDKDESSAGQIAAEAQKLDEDLHRYELQCKLTGKNDHRNAFISFQAGTGGDDAKDWTDMVMRMYVRWAEKKGYKVTFFDVDFHEAAGINSATLKIEGPYAFGYLKGEIGVHRPRPNLAIQRRRQAPDQFRRGGRDAGVRAG